VGIDILVFDLEWVVVCGLFFLVLLVVGFMGVGVYELFEVVM